jgi:hypothetical protein
MGNTCLIMPERCSIPDHKKADDEQGIEALFYRPWS